MKEVDTLESERGQGMAGLVLKRNRDGRRVYSPSHKRAIVEQCLRPGVSVAGIALPVDRTVPLEPKFGPVTVVRSDLRETGVGNARNGPDLH